ncbi:hypothetical protein, partial [Paraburkholderia domus]|uniref:hypothetical protein n=1 Tax=Paraburkholderia domus TaxID=2793075 RepID=UPI001B8D24B2
FTASSRSSGVYVLGFVICAPIDKVYQKGVSEKVRLPQRAASTDCPTIKIGSLLPQCDNGFVYYLVFHNSNFMN